MRPFFVCDSDLHSVQPIIDAGMVEESRINIIAIPVEHVVVLGVIELCD